MYWVFHADELARALADYNAELPDASAIDAQPPLSDLGNRLVQEYFGEYSALPPSGAAPTAVIRFLTSDAAQRHGLVCGSTTDKEQ